MSEFKNHEGLLAYQSMQKILENLYTQTECLPEWRAKKIAEIKDPNDTTAPAYWFEDFAEEFNKLPKEKKLHEFKRGIIHGQSAKMPSEYSLNALLVFAKDKNGQKISPANIESLEAYDIVKLAADVCIRLEELHSFFLATNS